MRKTIVFSLLALSMAGCATSKVYWVERSEFPHKAGTIQYKWRKIAGGSQEEARAKAQAEMNVYCGRYSLEPKVLSEGTEEKVVGATYSGNSSSINYAYTPTIKFVCL